MDVQEAIRDLRSAPQHWFCPRTSDSDEEAYLPEDLRPNDNADPDTLKSRQDAIDKFENRKQTVLAVLQLFQYEPKDEASAFIDGFKREVAKKLHECSVCVREYHNLRSTLQNELEMQHQPEEVAVFMKKFDEFNNERIRNCLDHATNQLDRLDEANRKLKNLDIESIFAFFEAMSSSVFAQNEALLAAHFDRPFQMVQGQKRLKVTHFLPAVTTFLFSNEPTRKEWAEKMWENIGRAPTMREFDNCIREPLLYALDRVQMSSLDCDFLPLFWRGMRIITSHLDEKVVMEGIRSLPLDPIRLSLDQLHLKEVIPSAFVDLVLTIAKFLQIAPRAYWDSVTSANANPQIVIDQIFGSPNTRHWLKRSESLEPIFSWVQPFIRSLPVSSTPVASRMLVTYFTESHREKANSAESRTICFDLALHSMHETAKRFVKDISVDPACIGELFDLFSKHSAEIYSSTRNRILPGSAETPLPLKLYQTMIELLSGLVIHGHRVLQSNKRISSYLLSLITTERWNSFIDPIKSGGISFAIPFLLGTRRISYIEEYTTKKEPLTSEQENFNKAYRMATESIVRVLDMVNDYRLIEIESFFKTPERSTGLLSYLFCGDDSVRIGATNILKTLNSDSSPNRRDALLALLGRHFEVTIFGLSISMEKVTMLKCFKSMASTILINMDVIDALFNSQDGILRARDLTLPESNATKFFWKTLWATLTVGFDQTEQWSLSTGYGQTTFKEFCRDVIQFANDLFNYHEILVNALSEDDSEDWRKQSITKQILDSPNQTLSHMLKWLRLRDVFLADKMVELVTGLLFKLHDSMMRITGEAQEALANVIVGKTHVKLGEGQLATLDQALETLTGVKIVKEPKIKEPKLSKASKQTSLSAYLKDVKDSATSDSDSVSEKAKIHLPGIEKFKSMAKKPSQASPLVQRESADEFRRKRMAEIEAAKKAKEALVAKQRQARSEALENQRLMAASDSSESESDDSDEMTEMEREIFGLPKKSGHSRPARGDINLINAIPKGPLKVKKTVRTVKDMRARVVPDLVPLHKTILGWDYFHPGDFPPKLDRSSYQKLPTKFTSPHEYQGYFEPLLFLEAWQSFVKAREENSFKPFQITVANRSSVDTFFEISTSLPMKEDSKREVSEGDIVLFSRSSNPSSSPDVDNCMARVQKISRKKGSLEIIYRTTQNSGMGRSLAPGNQIWAIKIQSLTPLEREYGALRALPYYDLSDYILKAQPAHMLSYNDNHLDPIVENYNVNKAQAKAVKSALDNDAFTLIQGPPGSGKTKTIIAIVGALLTSTLNSRQITSIKVSGMPARHTSTIKKLLICAPSNAAVDELVMRLKQGVKTMSGEEKSINIVRLGRSDAINAAVQDVTLEELVNARLGHNAAQRERGQLDILFKEYNEMTGQINTARDKLEKENTSTAKQEFESLKSKKASIGAQIDALKDKEKNEVRTAELERKKVQQAILDDAHVICATLSGSGHEMFQSLSNIEFETVVVDEAAQCVEASALIPLKYGCTKCILVGDPKQLPPTVLSKEATRFQYEQSLFVRMQINSPDDIHLLDTQYRMHPDISSFPSATFYDGLLLDGPGMAKLRVRPWHRAPLLGPYRFFDVKGQHEAASKGHSLINSAEIEVAMQLYERLSNDFGDYNFQNKIGIITPYKSQLAELKNRFSHRYGRRILDMVEFNTTDAFQGRESEVIIFSCVRASPSGGIGFLQDIRRMNVGLTRAKSSLWVLGNSESLQRGEFWAKMIDDAKRRSTFCAGNYMSELRRPTPIELRSQSDSVGTGLRNGAESKSGSSSMQAANAPRTLKRESTIASDVSMDDAGHLPPANDVPNKMPTTLVNAPLPVANARHPASEPKATYTDTQKSERTYDSKPNQASIPQRTETQRGVLNGGPRPPQQIRRVTKRPSSNPLLPPTRPKKPKPT